ncbi:MAG: exopolysaccharide biosynthesis polyprenyl glycosylphosphotransferase [Candidatus Gracilibacteria bacterium]|nr:exopolysaccharide biosynthesis polyprenyl glycosylphosphotransferase [Candidatus Gracilibacteria bacterium]MDD2909260.1 exopolysaccharide biosynthesis polyprenyl glycosylphosphotransferase [Candidatus Gracilibacteria bacterium]
MKRHELFFGIIKLPIEILIVYLSFFIARDIRRVTDLIPGVQIPFKNIPDYNLRIFALVGAILFALVFFYMGLYKIQIKNSRIKQFASIIEGGFFWFMLYIGGLYLSLGENFIYTTELPRLIIFFTLFISIFWITVERIIVDSVQKYLLKTGKLEKTKIALIINDTSEDIIEEINNSKIYQIIGYYNNKKIHDINIKYLGNSRDFAKGAQSKGIEEVLFVSSDFENEEIDEIFEYSRIYGIAYKYIANSFDFTKNNTETTFLSKIPVVEIRSIGLGPWGRVLKRIIDLVGSFFGIIILLPALILVGILIKKEDPAGPIIYTNKRVGKNGSFFGLYKFRYMKREYCVKDAYGVKPEEDSALKFEKELIKEKSERSGPLYKILNDPRKTKIGTFIEKYSIDELPQLFNVFMGDMSLVGPRPHQPREVELYKDYQKRVLTLKPGITGMAQTHGRHKNSFDDEVRLDIFYIENWSFLLDLKIMLKTIKVVLGK